jgi:hypothetical protein
VRWSDETGAVGGVEVLPFGFLVFVAGTLLLANAWAVIEGEVATSAAAREAARAYVESPGPAGAALAEARAAARSTIEGYGRDPGRMRLEAVGPLRFRRCARATFEVTYSVATVSVPWIGAFGGGLVETSARHSEVVDPYRGGVPLAAGDEAVRCDA